MINKQEEFISAQHGIETLEEVFVINDVLWSRRICSTSSFEVGFGTI